MRCLPSLNAMQEFLAWGTRQRLTGQFSGIYSTSVFSLLDPRLLSIKLWKRSVALICKAIMPNLQIPQSQFRNVIQPLVYYPTLRVMNRCIYPGRRATFSLRRKMKKLKCLFFTINEMSDCSNFFFYFCFRLNTKEYDLTWMYTEGREMAVFTDQQFEFALMKMRGMVDYEFLVKLRPVHLRMENQEADDS